MDEKDKVEFKRALKVVRNATLGGMAYGIAFGFFHGKRVYLGKIKSLQLEKFTQVMEAKIKKPNIFFQNPMTLNQIRAWNSVGLSMAFGKLAFKYSLGFSAIEFLIKKYFIKYKFMPFTEIAMNGWILGMFSFIRKELNHLEVGTPYHLSLLTRVIFGVLFYALFYQIYTTIQVLNKIKKLNEELQETKKRIEKLQENKGNKKE